MNEHTLPTPTQAPAPSPLEAKLDELIAALNLHTQAVFMWADSCNALLNALLQSEEVDDERFITDLKGNRIPLHPTTPADTQANTQA